MNSHLQKIDPCCFAVGTSGYFVEKMAGGLWDAYQPDALGYRLWQSTRHATRKAAVAAISMECRRIQLRVRNAIARAAIDKAEGRT